jgi:two-component system, chemotaxis family, chemotaxis protein CheY
VRFELLKVLLVDDNQHMKVLLGEILRAIGVREVFSAADGVEALEMMRGREVDIVFTDLNMKPMDGIDFVRRLRTAPDSPNPFAPVIMITGHSTRSRVEAARDAGVNEFLAKPITARSVLDRIQRVVEHPRPFIRSETYFGPDRRRRDDPTYSGPKRRAADRGPGDPDAPG